MEAVSEAASRSFGFFAGSRGESTSAPRRSSAPSSVRFSGASPPNTPPPRWSFPTASSTRSLASRTSASTLRIARLAASSIAPASLSSSASASGSTSGPCMNSASALSARLENFAAKSRTLRPKRSREEAQSAARRRNLALGTQSRSVSRAGEGGGAAGAAGEDPSARVEVEVGGAWWCRRVDPLSASFRASAAFASSASRAALVVVVSESSSPLVIPSASFAASSRDLSFALSLSLRSACVRTAGCIRIVPRNSSSPSSRRRIAPCLLVCAANLRSNASRFPRMYS